MTTLTRTYLPLEGALRDWLRLQSALTSLAATGVFVGVPDKVTGRFVALQRVAGGPDGSDTPVDLPVVQFDCWADVGDRRGAEQVAYALASLLSSVAPGTLLATGLVFDGAHVTLGPIFRPDRATNRPRFQMDAQLAVHATG